MKERKGREEKSEGESKVKEGEGEKKKSISACMVSSVFSNARVLGSTLY